MKSNNLEKLLIENFQQFINHWKNTNREGILADTLIVSISDGYKRAKVITPTINKGDMIEKDGQRILEMLLSKLEWATSHFDNDLKWMRIEWVTTEKEFTWKDFNQELRRYKRNYFRSGIAFEGKTKPWCLLTEMELNANACLYAGNDVSYAKANLKNLNKYIKSRHSSNNLPSFDDEMTLIVFNTEGVFLDASTGEFIEIESKPRNKGRRIMLPLNSDSIQPIISQSACYLANQVQPTGKYVYGYFPCFNRTINTYNALRHASSTYALIEGYEACKKFNILSVQQLEEMLSQIDNALDYTANTLIRTYGYKSYVVDTGDEIKLGANAVAILAFVEYIQVFPNNDKTERYLSIANKLALGILDMQQDDGSFVHVLHSKDLTLKQKNRIIYYDGEAAFALMRLYGLTKDERWLNCVEKAFDYFIEAKHYRAHDHWLSYCSNELVLYKPERKYFQFAVDNIKGYTDFIKNRITTFPTLLELSMAFHKMLLKLDDYPEYHDVLEGFDVHDFYQALHARANYLLNGFFFPEVAMFFKAPNTILHGFFIRHHSFRVRIDDVEHYLSGLVAYQELMVTQNYPMSLGQMNCNLLHGDSVLTSKALEVATGGQWLVRPNEEWEASGLCIHPGSFKEGALLVARGKNMEKGYLPQPAVKSFTLKGAGAIVTDDENRYLDFGVPVLLVPNVRQATLDIGKWSRKSFSGYVIGVTGSAGKTTTVAMLSHALQTQGEVAQTKGSANLPIGIAWNMASMPQKAITWVLEMAIGNMALNTQLVQPNVAIVTNIAAAHLEYHNTLDIVAIKKSRIFEGMKPGEVAIICRDIEQYELIVQKAKMHGLTIINYGEHTDSDIRLINYTPSAAQISIDGQIYTLEMSSIGKHMVLNAMAVLAVADCKSLDISKVINQLKSFTAIEGRGEVSKTSFAGKQITVYNEAYNANPLSMKAALKAFSEVNVHAQNKLVILGDMLELGANSQQYHLDLAQDIKDVDFREIILVGDLVLELGEVLKQLDKAVHHFKDKDSLAEHLPQIINDNDSVLIKASNGIGLEKLFTQKVAKHVLDKVSDR